MKSRQVVQEDTSASDSGEDYHPEEDGPDSVVARGPKSRASTRTTSKQKGKQHQKRRNAGKLSRLPDMPLDILYEVSHRTKYIIYDGVPEPMDLMFADILPRSSGGPTADVVGQQALSERSHKQVLEAGLGSRFR